MTASDPTCSSRRGKSFGMLRRDGNKGVCDQPESALHPPATHHPPPAPAPCHRPPAPGSRPLSASARPGGSLTAQPPLTLPRPEQPHLMRESG